MEMSVGTIVTVVLAMMMLIGGIVLIKNIISGSSNNIDTMNQKTKDQINKLFTEDKRTVVYLPNQLAEIKQGDDYGIGFAVANLARGTAEAGSFSYEVKITDPDVTAKCGISEGEVQSWITTGRASSMTIAPGENYYGIIRFLAPENAPLCTVRFNIEVTKDGSAYATDFFDVEVTP